MKLINKFDKEIRFLLSVIDSFSKYAWAIILKDKYGITITNACRKIFKESNLSPKKMWVNKCRELYNNLINKTMTQKKWHRHVFNT